MTGAGDVTSNEIKKTNLSWLKFRIFSPTGASAFGEHLMVTISNQ